MTATTYADLGAFLSDSKPTVWLSLQSTLPIRSAGHSADRPECHLQCGPCTPARIPYGDPHRHPYADRRSQRRPHGALPPMWTVPPQHTYHTELSNVDRAIPRPPTIRSILIATSNPDRRSQRRTTEAHTPMWTATPHRTYHTELTPKWTVTPHHTYHTEHLTTTFNPDCKPQHRPTKALSEVDCDILITPTIRST